MIHIQVRGSDLITLYTSIAMRMWLIDMDGIEAHLTGTMKLEIGTSYDFTAMLVPFSHNHPRFLHNGLESYGQLHLV